MKRGPHTGIPAANVIFKGNDTIERYLICESGIKEPKEKKNAAPKAQTKKVSPPKRRVAKISKGNVSKPIEKEEFGAEIDVPPLFVPQILKPIEIPTPQVPKPSKNTDIQFPGFCETPDQDNPDAWDIFDLPFCNSPNSNTFFWF